MATLFKANSSSNVDDCYAFETNPLWSTDSVRACTNAAGSNNISITDISEPKYQGKGYSISLDGILFAAYAALSCFFIFASLEMSRNLIHARNSDSHLKCPRSSYRINQKYQYSKKNLPY